MGLPPLPRDNEYLDVCVRWSPGHMGIKGNEVADRLADREAHDPQEPSHLAAVPTVTGLRTDARTQMYGAQLDWWKDKRPKLSNWYKRWELPYSTISPEELTLSRPVLAKLVNGNKMSAFSFLRFLSELWKFIERNRTRAIRA